MHERTIRARINALLEELAGPIDIEAKSAALDEIIELAILMRAEMEATDGLDYRT